MIGGKSNKRTKVAAAPVPATPSSTTPEEILLPPSLENTPTSVLAQLVAELQRRKTESPISKSQLAASGRIPVGWENLSYSAFNNPAENGSPGRVESPLKACIVLYLCR